jgi:hypothetical protein
MSEYWPEREEITGSWRKFNDEEFHNLNLSLNTINVTKLRQMRWEKHAAHMENINGGIILKWFL